MPSIIKIMSRVFAAAVFVTLVSPAGAQSADKRSFFHPLGVWSNHCFVAQKRVYPRRANFRHAHVHAADADLIHTSEGGWLLYERDW